MPHQVIVRCTIDNCDYWGHNNECYASEILITSDRFSREQPASIDAPQASNLDHTPADDAEATCCKTFRPRGSRKGPNLF